jgi:hypothetical protein
VPLIGATDNHVPAEADAVKLNAAGLPVTEIGCAAGVGDPIAYLNDSIVGVAVRVEEVAFTVSATVVVWLRLPEVPVIVTVEVPVAAVKLAVSVKELVVVAEAGLKDAVTPLGRLDAEKLTLPAKPFWGATVMVLEPLDPWAMLRLLGDAERLKSGEAVALTVSETVVVWLRLPEVPVIVTVEVPVAAVLLAVSVRELVRSEERRVGKECLLVCRSRWSPYH